MGFLDNSSITVDAILTKRGRQILASGGNLNITKFALSDEEVDYTLWDVTHPNGTDSYGTVIENMSLLEATPVRTGFRSHLINQSLAGSELLIDRINYPDVDKNTTISISPTTQGGVAELYTFTIENTNVVSFQGGTQGTKTVTKDKVDLIAMPINPGATTNVTITGVQSALSKVVTITVVADPASNTDPKGPQDPILDDKFEAGGAGMASGAGPYG